LKYFNTLFFFLRTLGSNGSEENELSIEMKTFHSKELSSLSKFSTYIGKLVLKMALQVLSNLLFFVNFLFPNFLNFQSGIRLKGSKIVFLKRNTTEIQVYIRLFLLTALKSRLKPYDSWFIKEFSRRVIFARYEIANDPNSNNNNNNNNNLEFSEEFQDE